MTPSLLLKLNLKHYKLVLFINVILLSLGIVFSNIYGIKLKNKYEILIVEDINTKLLIDSYYQREGTKNDEYYKYLKNYTISEFVSSKYNEYGSIDINKQGKYFIVTSFSKSNEEKIIEFEENLTIFLEKMQKIMNEQITQNFQFRIGKDAIGIKTDSKLFCKKTSSRKGHDPISIYFATLIFGIIISNFIIILENPPKR